MSSMTDVDAVSVTYINYVRASDVVVSCHWNMYPEKSRDFFPLGKPLQMMDEVFHPPEHMYVWIQVLIT